MAIRQTPINSGFGAKTQASEVMAGRDLSGKTAIVTGGYSGLGLETTKALADAGARVIVTARRPDVAREALLGLDEVEVQALDLAELASVRRFAEAFSASRRRADIVINNAGVMACPETRVGPGWEAQFATNHLGHYALVNLLWPSLADDARVVAVSSAGHHYSAIRWDDVQFERGYDKWLAYAQSKTANALFAIQLDALGRERGVHAFALHPGSIATPLQRHVPRAEMIALGWMDEAGNPASPTRSRPRSRGLPPSCGLRPLRCWRGWAGSTARIATSQASRRTTRAPWPAYASMRSIRSRPAASGGFRRRSPGSTHSRPSRAHGRRRGYRAFCPSNKHRDRSNDLQQRRERYCHLRHVLHARIVFREPQLPDGHDKRRTPAFRRGVRQCAFRHVGRGGALVAGIRLDDREARQQKRWSNGDSRERRSAVVGSLGF